MDKIIFKKDTKLDIICLGRLGLDLNCNEINTPLKNVTSFSPTLGGSPGNIAIGASQIGVKVGFIGKTSDDQIGDYIVSQLERYNIDTSNVVRDKTGAKNCLAITEIISPSNCGSVLYRDGTSDLNLEITDICKEYIRQAKVLLISGTALSKSPSREATLLAIEYAKETNTLVAIDIDYRDYTWRSKEETSLYYKLACDKCDIIIGTREEFDSALFIWKEDNKEDDKIAQNFIKKGATLVAIKRGEDGSRVYTKDNDIYSFGIFKSDILKTFGAGDAYASSFLSSLIQGDTILNSMEKGSASASIVLLGKNCSASMPTLEELNAFILERNEVQ